MPRPAAASSSLGGDSLSYVELATRLGARLGELPPGWHTLTAAELAAAARPRRRRGTLVETTIALRAVAIVLVVGTHANLMTVVGGAHLLLAVAGFNLARFHLGDRPRRQRLRQGLASLAQVAVPSALFIGGVTVATGMYDPATALFLNDLVGSDSWTVEWQFWFLEALAVGLRRPRLPDGGPRGGPAGPAGAVRLPDGGAPRDARPSLRLDRGRGRRHRAVLRRGGGLVPGAGLGGGPGAHGVRSGCSS